MLYFLCLTYIRTENIKTYVNKIYFNEKFYRQQTLKRALCITASTYEYIDAEIFFFLTKRLIAVYINVK